MGYLGPLVVKQLRQAYPEARLMGYDMGYFAHCLTGNDILPECHVDTQHIGDIRGIDVDLLKGVDAVVHLSAISNDPMGKAFEAVTEAINYRASVRLANAAKQAGVKRFVFSSSCSVYGAAEDAPRTEKSELNPLTAYARSKINTELELEKLADKNFVVTCLRFATACGMSDRLRLDLVLNDFVAGAIASKKITILSDGTPWRPLIHVSDMARAIHWAVERAFTGGGVFLAVNTGCDEWNYQVKDLAEAVARVIPEIEISINENAQPDKRSYRVSFDLFKELAPVHQPQVNLLEAIKTLKQGLESIRFDDADFRNSSYIRLKVLKQLQERRQLNENLEWIGRIWNLT